MFSQVPKLHPLLTDPGRLFQPVEIKKESLNSTEKDFSTVFVAGDLDFIVFSSKDLMGMERIH